MAARASSPPIGQFVFHFRHQILDAELYGEVENVLNNWDELLAAGTHDPHVVLEDLRDKVGLIIEPPGFDEAIFTQEKWNAAIEDVRSTKLWSHTWLCITAVAILARGGYA